MLVSAINLQSLASTGDCSCIGASSSSSSSSCDTSSCTCAALDAEATQFEPPRGFAEQDGWHSGHRVVAQWLMAAHRLKGDQWLAFARKAAQNWVSASFADDSCKHGDDDDLMQIYRRVLTHIHDLVLEEL